MTIETAIKDLGKNPKIKKDDPILIYYAGHGAEAKAPSGWSSANGKMQMLVPSDFIPSGSKDSKRGQGVLDTRLSHLLADLAARKSDNIVDFHFFYHASYLIRCMDRPLFSIIVTLARAHGRMTMIQLSPFVGIDLPGAYTVAQDLLHDIEPDARASVVAKGFGKTGLLLHVLLSACKHGQEAGERGGRGVFTSALLSLLQQSDLDKFTYKDIITNLPDLPE